MTNRCFSSSQLYALRNEISIRVLIEKTMRIPCRVAKGCFRFLCPVCNGFDTAVNPETNLARCFRCEKNFNTIDLVMLVRQAKFVDSVKFLQSIHQKKSACRDVGRIKHNTPQEKSGSGPSQIGQIIAGILPLENGDTPSEYKQAKPIAPHQVADENRMAMLELQLEHLGRQIQELSRTINAGHPTK